MDRRGFTLLEVVVATAIFGGMMLITLTVMKRMVDSSSERRSEVFIKQVAARTGEEIATLLRQAVSVDGIQAQSIWDSERLYRFQVPVTSPTTSTAVDTSGEVVMGAIKGGTEMLPGGEYLLRFVKTGTYREIDRGHKINLLYEPDPDATDEFDIGRIEILVKEAGGEYKEYYRTPDIVFQQTLEGTLRAAGSTAVPPMSILEIVPPRIHVALFVGDPGRPIPMLHLHESSVHLRNSQR